MKKIFAIAIAALFAVSANAQDCCNDGNKKCCGGFAPYWYVQFQGGAEMPFSPGHKISPVVGFNIGRMVNPIFGARLGIEGFWNKVQQESGDYKKMKYFNINADALLNVVNVLSEKKCHPVNFYLLAGVGFDRSSEVVSGGSNYMANARMGAILDWRIIPDLSISLEGRVNNSYDKWNGIVGSDQDWYGSVLLGVAYNFGFRPSKLKQAQDKINQLQAQYEAARAAAEVAQAEADKAKAAAAKAQAEAAAAKKAPTNAVAQVEKEVSLPNVFFQCAKSNVQKAQQGNVATIAKWMNENPNAQIVITGYASPDGSAKLNEKLSEKRANAVADMLVKKYGIAADRISTKAGGETGELFSENNLNRVAVSVAK